MTKQLTFFFVFKTKTTFFSDQQWLLEATQATLKYFSVCYTAAKSKNSQINSFFKHIALRVCTWRVISVAPVFNRKNRYLTGQTGIFFLLVDLLHDSYLFHGYWRKTAMQIIHVFPGQSVNSKLSKSTVHSFQTCVILLNHFWIKYEIWIT